MSFLLTDKDGVEYSEPMVLQGRDGLRYWKIKMDGVLYAQEN